jgi:hypothetical protein
MLLRTYYLCHTVATAGEGVLLYFLQIILSVAEHHGNLVPWQLLAARSGAVLRFVPLTHDKSELDMAVCLLSAPCIACLLDQGCCGVSTQWHRDMQSVVTCRVS